MTFSESTIAVLAIPTKHYPLQSNLSLKNYNQERGNNEDICMVSIQMVSVAPIRSHPLPDLVIKPLKHVQLSTKLREKLKALPELGSTKATSKLI